MAIYEYIYLYTVHAYIYNKCVNYIHTYIHIYIHIYRCKVILNVVDTINANRTETRHNYSCIDVEYPHPYTHTADFCHAGFIQ